MSDDLDRWLAENVMGWKWDAKREWWVATNGDCWFPLDWNPSTDIAQAMMCLEKFPRWDLFKFRDGTIGCLVWDKNDEVYESDCNHKTPELAICRAIEKIFNTEKTDGNIRQVVEGGEV